MTARPGHLARSANDANGTRTLRGVGRWPERGRPQDADLGLHVGAGEGNRTLMTSLEGWGSAIELRPRVPAEGCVWHRVSIDSVPVSRHRGRTARAGPGRAECLGFVLRLRDGPRRVTVVMHAMWAPRRRGGLANGRVGYGSVPRDVAQLG